MLVLLWLSTTQRYFKIWEIFITWLTSLTLSKITNELLFCTVTSVAIRISICWNWIIFIQTCWLPCFLFIIKCIDCLIFASRIFMHSRCVVLEIYFLLINWFSKRWIGRIIIILHFFNGSCCYFAYFSLMLRIDINEIYIGNWSIWKLCSVPSCIWIVLLRWILNISSICFLICWKILRRM